MSQRGFIYRYCRNKLALAGASYVLFVFLLAVFAYALAPDNSVDANRQMPELSAKPPGYTQMFLHIPSDEAGENSIFTGYDDQSKWIPIQQYRLKKDSIMIERYVDEDTCVWQVIHIGKMQLNGVFNEKAFIRKTTFYLGTDGMGRDMLSRLIVGTRISFAAGIIGVLVSLLIGVLLGAWAGYYGGWTDRLINWLMSINWALPALMMAFAITMLLGKGATQIMLAIGLTMWVNVARLVRGLVQSTKELEYVQAAKALGFSDSRIIIRHILPNITSPILVLSVGNFAGAIMIEAGLSFLGLGVQPPTPSWGGMLRAHYQFLLTDHPLPAIIPGLAIMLLVLSFNLMGNGLRDALDVKT